MNRRAGFYTRPGRHARNRAGMETRPTPLINHDESTGEAFVIGFEMM